MRRLFSWLLHLIFACVPGCGQMYQGYMKRGISQTLLTCFVVFFAVLLETGSLAVLIVPLWLYSFFDSFNLRRQWKDGYVMEDEYMFGLSDMDSQRLTEILRRRHGFIGWVLVAVGLYNLYHIFAYRFLNFIQDIFPFMEWLYDLLVWDAPRIMITVLIIAIGMWFVRGPNLHLDEDTPDAPPPPRRKAPAPPPPPKPSPWTKAEETFHEKPEPQAPDIPETPAPPEGMEWESEFDVEKFEKMEQEKNPGKEEA